MNETIKGELDKIKVADAEEKRKLLPIDEEAFSTYCDDIYNFFKADTRRKRAKKVLDNATREYNDALAEQEKYTEKIHKILKEVNSDDNSSEGRH